MAPIEITTPVDGYPPSRMFFEQHSERERSNQRIFQNVTLLELFIVVNTNDKRSDTIITDNLDVLFTVPNVKIVSIVFSSSSWYPCREP